MDEQDRTAVCQQCGKRIILADPKTIRIELAEGFTLTLAESDDVMGALGAWVEDQPCPACGGQLDLGRRRDH
jgi:hypothetical protein